MLLKLSDHRQFDAAWRQFHPHPPFRAKEVKVPKTNLVNRRGGGGTELADWNLDKPVLLHLGFARHGVYDHQTGKQWNLYPQIADHSTHS